MMKKLISLLFGATLMLACSSADGQGLLPGQPTRPEVTAESVYIIGDSYSTFDGFIPAGNAIWYPKAPKINNVQEVSQTWWHLLCKEMNFTLVKNNSFSGSTICNTGYNGADSSKSSYVTRMRDDFGPNKTLSPSIILIYGGTNDSWANSPVGEPKFKNWTANDLKQVAPAICRLFAYLREWNPDALILNLSNPFLNEGIRSAFKAAAAEYGIHNLELKSFDLSGGHPNISGMRSICDQVKAMLIKVQE